MSLEPIKKNSIVINSTGLVRGFIQLRSTQNQFLYAQLIYIFVERVRLLLKL